MTAVEIRPGPCSRSACRAQIYLEPPPKHRDTGLPYCLKCARRINEACGVELVTWNVDARRSAP